MALSDSVNVTLEVAPVNDAPTLVAPLADQSFAEDHAVSFTLPAGSFTDVDNASLSYAATLDDGTALPDWLDFDADTQSFSGTPPQDFNGMLAIKVTASDSEFNASDTFTLPRFRRGDGHG